MKLESDYRFLRDTLAIVLLVAGPACISGCGRAHSDLYQQRMASEIRVLEDQLYDADYQNQVLQEKLHRYQDKVQSSRIPTPDLDQGPISPPALPTGALPPFEFDLATPQASSPLEGITPEPAFDSSSNVDTLDIPSFNMGEPFDPNLDATSNHESGRSVLVLPAGEIPPPVRPVPPAQPAELGTPSPSKAPQASVDSESVKTPRPLRDPPSSIDNFTEKPKSPQPKLTKPPARNPSIEFLPPPSTPMPPGKNELRPNAIIPGSPKPPAGDGDSEAPPGQIRLPEGVQSPLRIPDSIRLHPSLSSGDHDGIQLDGATIVVNAFDATGKRVDLNQFDIDAKLSVVVLDPERSPSEARIGRWDFNAKQLDAMISNDRGKGFEIPIHFHDAKPTTDKVIVHVRLRGEDHEMRCHLQLDLRERTAESPWTPRGTEQR